MKGISPRTAGIAFAAGLVIVVGVSLTSYRNTRELSRTDQWVRHTYDVLGELQSVFLEMQDVQSGARGYLLSGDEIYLIHFNTGVSHAQEDLEHLKGLASDNPRQQERLNALQTLVAQRISVSQEINGLRKSKGFDASLEVFRSGKGHTLMEEIRQVIHEMTNEEQALLRRRLEDSEKATRRSEYIQEAGTALGLAIFVVIFQLLRRDISERKRGEEQIRRLNKELGQHLIDLTAANKDLESFAYSVSHDLRAPLRHIDGFSGLLMEKSAGELAPESRRCLEVIRESTQRMGRMLDDFLALSRLGRQDLKLQMASLDVIAEDALGDLKSEISIRHIDFRKAKLPFAECDPLLMRQVFANLFSNALKFTRQRDPAVIEVGAQSDNGVVIFFVRDNGVGFSMKYVDQLFGVFQRLHRQEDFEGTGVGLATVQRIIQKHGGHIWAEAELNKGASFFFTLEHAKTSVVGEAA